MKVLYTILITFMLSTVSSTLYANETGYEIELIIFEDVRARYLNSEDWSYNDMLDKIENPETKTTSKNDPEYRELEWKSAKLEKNLEHLTNNTNFRVLLNKRWRQTGLDRDKTYDIPINAQISTQNIDLVNEENKPESTPYITGTIKLIMSRYLHFNVNLEYHRLQFDENNEQISKVFPIINERRMRSREIHYIDHPLVGIIVLATPYKITTSKDDVKATGYKTL